MDILQFHETTCAICDRPVTCSGCFDPKGDHYCSRCYDPPYHHIIRSSGKMDVRGVDAIGTRIERTLRRTTILIWVASGVIAISLFEVILRLLKLWAG